MASYIIYIFLGMLAAFGSLILETAASIFISPENGGAVVLSITWFLVACAAIEEILKFAVIFNTISQKDLKKLIFLKSFFIGLGFSVFEIVLNLYKINFQRIDLLMAFSLSGIFLIHILTAGYIGYVIAILKDSKKILSAVVVIFTFLLHLAYNLTVIYNAPPLAVLPFLGALIIILILRFSRLRLAE